MSILRAKQLEGWIISKILPVLCTDVTPSKKLSESFGHTWLSVSPGTVASQAPLSMQFSRQEYQSGLPFPSPGGSSRPRDWNRVSCIAGWFMLCLVTQSCPTLCNSVDYSPAGSSVHGDSPGKNTWVGGHALLQGIFQIQGLNPCLLCLLHWQACTLLLVPPGKSKVY